MECRIAQSLLEAYLDGELDRDGARALEAHADGCAECSAELGKLDELRRALRAPALRHAAPAALRERLAAAVAGAQRSRSRARVQPSWLRYAAACLLAFGAGAASVQWWNAGRGADAQLTRDLFASHWRALAATSPVDVVSSDRHTVKPWFAGKLAQAPLVQDFAGQGFALAGGRIDYVGDARVPVLVYRHGAHLIDVFVLPQDASARSVAATRVHGYRVEPVRLGDAAAAVISDMDDAELARFEELLARAQ